MRIRKGWTRRRSAVPGKGHGFVHRTYSQKYIIDIWDKQITSTTLLATRAAGRRASKKLELRAE